MGASDRRIGFAVKVLGREGLRSHDTRRWQSGPSLGVSIEALHRILDYVDEIDVRMYRIASGFVPYATHPEMPRFHGQIEARAAELRAVGEHAARLGVRLSVHPSQYIVLNAEDRAIAESAMRDLDVHARLLDAMAQGPEAVVVLHVGGVYGDKEAALHRFAANHRELSEPARRRLVVENDEFSFTVRDCLGVHEATGAPVVFDHQHHRLNPDDLETVDAATAALATWPDDVRPKIHFSSPRLDGRTVQRGGRARIEAPLLRQHADYVDPWTFADLVDALGRAPFDVMLEAKAKELAVLKLRGDLRSIGRTGVLRIGDFTAGSGSG